MERVEGVEGTERILDRLTAAMARFQEQLDRIYRQQREREEARRLREEQVRLFSVENLCLRSVPMTVGINGLLDAVALYVG